MKTENKIILMISVGFGLLIMVFFWFANRVFDIISSDKLEGQRYKEASPIQELQSNFKAALDSFNTNISKEEGIEIRQIKYLNNIVEQDHRFIKKRTKPMLGFKNFYSAKETISGIENIRIIQKGQVSGQKPNQSAFNNFGRLMA